MSQFCIAGPNRSSFYFFYRRQSGYIFAFLRMCVRLSVCQQNNSRKLSTNFVEIPLKVGMCDWQQLIRFWRWSGSCMMRIRKFLTEFLPLVHCGPRTMLECTYLGLLSPSPSVLVFFFQIHVIKATCRIISGFFLSHCECAQSGGMCPFYFE